MNSPILTEAEHITWLRVDVGLAMSARREASRLAKRVGLPPDRVSAVELAATEAATNLQKHAVDGALALRVTRSGPRAGVEFVATDTGPGITHLASALADGTSSTGTLGVGLGAIARLADVFDIHTLPGRGTTVLAQFWAGEEARRAEPAGIDAGGLTRPIGGEELCGDTWALRSANASAGRGAGGGPGSVSANGPGLVPAQGPGGGSGPVSANGPGSVSETGPGGGSAQDVSAPGPDAGPVLAMMCDGLGHGPQAARAGDVAREAFRDSAHTRPHRVLEDLHRALRGTRGAAVAVARVDFAAGTVEFSGVGNVSAFLVRDERRSSLLSVPGIVGHHMPHTRSFGAEAGPGSVLVMHTDGLSDRWSPQTFPGLFARRSTVISAQILREAGGRRDDIGILAVKAPRP
ncbi:ATP-binding protein [Streptomyces lichenis]|uniref:SpoIIE family protein phosphatase n=1 Tax=Streptomyces lichenis TaxID=2306967 RepID=A0ABT0I9K4_9ACTN|nr:ATP-binding SpoIIE family protein phosphatase [Streptomyces lichenis]MCK8678001.1 SpoIIE family protein phosphatase [Streptomyces lichenis]